ncbi:hypothetical protein BD410DRAFT_898940 [Rickenella mellea]|uniref:Uncharacterized protein n=1 Tax=Rickenella mellea TaxID=50990 RepID=A0A4Y7Q220_9AGAM|nr:hypothetical protein BD410DRAFT_898940 [Rickenella mellea]
MGPNDDQFTWINTAPPSTSVIVSARDASGQISVSTGLVLTQGGSDLTCPGRQSFSGSSTAVSPPLSFSTLTPIGASTVISTASVISASTVVSISTAVSTSTAISELVDPPSYTISPSSTGTLLSNTGSVKTTRNNNVAIIAGAAAGGTALLLGAFLASWRLRKKRGAYVSQKLDMEGTPREIGNPSYPKPYASVQRVEPGRGASNVDGTPPGLILNPFLTNPLEFSSTDSHSHGPSDQILVANEARPCGLQPGNVVSTRTGPVVRNSDSNPSATSRPSSAYERTGQAQQEVVILRHSDAGPALKELPPAYEEQSNWS